MTEPILSEETNRYTLFPITYPEVWKAYKTQKQCFWTAEEIDYVSDKKDWESLNDNEKYFIEHILAFFAGSDGIVLENLVQNFCKEVKIAEARCAYAFQAMMENIHSEVYSLLIDTYVDKDRKEILFNAIETIPCIKEKADWAIKWINENRTFAERLVAFAVVEGVFFSGSFCAIFWLKSRGKMVKALGTSNELIARDEGMHTDFAVLLYNKLNKKLDQETIHQIFREAVTIEKKFICESLPCNLIGMNQLLMSQYIEFVADRLISQLGYQPMEWTDENGENRKSSNPFDFMNKTNLDGKTNFFDKRVSEYQLSSGIDMTSDFVLDDDF